MTSTRIGTRCEREENGTFKYLPWDQENRWDPTVNRTTVASPPSGLHPKLVASAQYNSISPTTFNVHGRARRRATAGRAHRAGTNGGLCYERHRRGILALGYRMLASISERAVSVLQMECGLGCGTHAPDRHLLSGARTPSSRNSARRVVSRAECAAVSDNATSAVLASQRARRAIR